VAKKRSRNHGGARPGAGRPRKYSTVAVQKTMNFPPEFWAITDAFEGSASERLCRALCDDRALRQMRAFFQKEAKRGQIEA
jgi:hypothetical protein